MAEHAPNGKNLAAGIKLVHDEIKGLRGDISGLRGDIHAALKEAAVDRQRADRRFEFLVETMREERKRADGQFRALVRSVVDVGRRILTKLDTNTELLRENTGILKENTGLLKDIKRGMNGGPGRPHGNGRSKA